MKDAEIEGVLDMIRNTLTKAKTWEFEAKRGLDTLDGLGPERECRPNDGYTIILRLNGGAVDRRIPFAVPA